MPKLKISPVFSPTSEFVLHEGDCLDLLSNVPDNFFQLIVTSPPYNVGKEYESRLDFGEYISQQKKIITECVRTLKPEGSICWQVGNYVNNGEIVPLDVMLFPIFSSLGLKLRNRIVWHFGHGLHASKRFSGRYEVVLWFTKTNNYFFDLDPVRVPQKYPQKKHFKGPRKGELSGNPLGKNPSDVWDIPNVKANHIEKTEHPAQFPVELIERLILSMTRKNDWILDPFLGSGTSAVAALIHNRRVAGAEIKKEYIEIVKKRIASAEKGELLVRPMNRDVFDPSIPTKNVPPRSVEIRKDVTSQPLLLKISESKRKYGK